MSVNSRLKATKIIGQRKAFYRQRFPEPSCVRKETVEIDILVTSKDDFSSRKDPSIFTSIEPLLLDLSNETS